MSRLHRLLGLCESVYLLPSSVGVRLLRVHLAGELEVLLSLLLQLSSRHVNRSNNITTAMFVLGVTNR